VLQQRLAEAWSAFLGAVSDARHPWLQIVRGHGRAAVDDVYAALLGARSRPQNGHVLTL
jgi:hypothetical protein